MKNKDLQSNQVTLEEHISGFFESERISPGDANNFFNSFGYVNQLMKGNYSTCLNGYLDVLNKCRSIDKDKYGEIHKGVPYYYIGTSAYLVNDYQTATFFFDAAVSEDLRAGHDVDNNLSPALRFILLEEDPQNPDRTIVSLANRRIQELIDDYNSRPGRPDSIPNLNIDQIRDNFLRVALQHGNERFRSLATTFITFHLEWDYRNQFLDLIPWMGTAEPFLLHLFKGCLLFESLLKANPRKEIPLEQKHLFNIVQFLQGELGTDFDDKTGNPDLITILQTLNEEDRSIQTAIRFTYWIRNTLGHNLGIEEQIDKFYYHHLFRMIASANLHAIGCLYGKDFSAQEP